MLGMLIKENEDLKKDLKKKEKSTKDIKKSLISKSKFE